MANIGDEIVDGSVRWIVRDTRSEATTVSSGLMSASDKIKLNGYPSKTTGNSKFLREDGTWQISYTLPKATSNTLGGMIVGNNLTVDGNGKVGVSLSGNANQVLKGNGTWGIIDSYTLPQASTTALGGVKISDKTGVTVGSGGIISLTAASKSAIGGIKFPGGTGSVLSAEGTWINNQVDIDSLLTSGKVYNLFKNHVDSNTTTQLLKDNLFLAGDGKWHPFIVNPPRQWGYIVYDGEDHVPDFSAMDTDEYAITAISANSTVASITNYKNYLNASVIGGSNRIKGREGLTIRNGALHATNAGVYLLQVSPRNNYVWSTQVKNWRGLAEYNNSYIGTQLPIVCHWTIRKAPNNISLSAKRAEAEFGNEVKIEYQTDSNDSLTIDAYEDWGVIVDDTRVNHSAAKTTMTEAQKKKLPFLSKDGYFEIEAKKDDIDTTQDILSYVMLKRINWSTTSYYNKKLRKQINYPVFTVSSAATENYYSKKATVKFINKRIASTLDYWEIEEDYSDLVLTNTIPRVIRLKYDGDVRPTITVSNSGLLEVKLLEDIVNDVIKAKLNSTYKDFDYILKNANVTGENASPESITLAADISAALSNDYTTNTTIVSATKYLYDSTATVTAASATLVKNTQTDPEIAADYNGVRIDEVKYPYLICMPLNSSSSSARKWWFYLESDYEFIASRKVKVWDDTSINSTDHHVAWKVELYKHYRSLTLILIPKGSSGQTTVTIRVPGRANFFNMKDSLKMNISISPSAATPLTGKSGGDPIILHDTITSADLTTAISRFDSGQGANYYKVGDYIPFKFIKALQLDSKDEDDNFRTLPTGTDAIYKAVLIGIDHAKDLYLHNYVGTTASVNKTKAGHFMIGKDSDNEQICIFGKKMNTAKSNSGGWANTELKTWLNDATNGFLSALPTQLQNNIKEYTKPSAINNNGDIGHTTDKIWLMAKGEMYPHTANRYVSDTELDGVTELYQYFKNGNSRFFYDHEDNTTGRRCWFRSRRNRYASQFVSIRAEEEGQGQETTYNSANVVLGVIPCFVL